MAALADVVQYLDAELRTAEVPDYDTAFNGLQLANSGTVTRVAAAVDFSAAAVAAAIHERADLLIVHHGMYWRSDPRLTGVAYERLRAAIGANLAVYSSHIPLDLHPTLGNNALLASALGLTPSGTFGRFRDVEIGVAGECDEPTATLLQRAREFSQAHATTLVHVPVASDRRTRRWAIVTGMGASSTNLQDAVQRGIDTLIVGEGTHHSAVDAMELGLVVAYAGHYATETPGVRALASAVARRFSIPSCVVNLPTGL